MLAFTTLMSKVKTNQDTMSAAIRMIKSTGMDVTLKGIHQAGEFWQGNRIFALLARKYRDSFREVTFANFIYLASSFSL